MCHCLYFNTAKYFSFRGYYIYILTRQLICYCSSVRLKHCVSSAKGCGFDSQGTHIMTIQMYILNITMNSKSLWIKASAKCINVNVNYQSVQTLQLLYLDYVNL